MATDISNDAAMQTPVMRQYFAAKEAHPDCLMFCRIGDFYELFYEDAIVASRELQLTLPASILAMAGYWWTGLWVPAVTHLYLISLPAAVPAIFLGRIANRRLPGDAFLKYVHCGLVAVGLLLLLQAIHKT